MGFYPGGFEEEFVLERDQPAGGSSDGGDRDERRGQTPRRTAGT